MPKRPDQAGQLLLRPRGRISRSFSRQSSFNPFLSAAVAIRQPGSAAFATITAIDGGVHVAQQHYTAGDSTVQLRTTEAPHEKMLRVQKKPPAEKYREGKNGQTNMGKISWASV